MADTQSEERKEELIEAREERGIRKCGSGSDSDSDSGVAVVVFGVLSAVCLLIGMNWVLGRIEPHSALRPPSLQK